MSLTTPSPVANGTSPRFDPLAQGHASRRWGIIAIWWLTIAFILLTGSPFVRAQARAEAGKPAFGLRPVYYDPSNPVTQSYFVFDTAPGAVIHNQVRVFNSGDAAGTAKLYAVDATTGQTSGTVFLSDQDTRQDAGGWIALGTQQITLAAGTSAVVPFTVIVPTAVRGGVHVGGLVVEDLEEATGSTSNGPFKISVQNLSIIAAQFNLPGAPVDQLEASGISAGGDHGSQQFFVSLHNAGNTLIKPYGTLTIRDASGHTVQDLRLTLDTFLPQTAIAYPVFANGQALGVGTYSADLTLTYGTAPRILTYHTTFSVTEQQLTQVFGPQANNTPPMSNLLAGISIGTVASCLLALFGLVCLAIFARERVVRHRQTRYRRTR